MKRVLGLGNALVDLIVRLGDDAALSALGLPKGSMQLVDHERASGLKRLLAGYAMKMSSGGSAANTIHGLSKLGIPAGYIGKVGSDDLGWFFRKDMELSGAQLHMLESDLETGQAITLLTPDSERTFATYLGAAVELRADELDATMFEPYQMLHLEGYLVHNEPLILRALDIAARLGMEVSLDLASYNVVEAHLSFLHHITAAYVDVLFANEAEAMAFTGKQPAEALSDMTGYCEKVFVKIGPGGVMAAMDDETWFIPALPAQVIDTNGAGDLFASGALAALALDKSPETAARLGVVCATRVIETIGTKMPETSWEQILRESQALLGTLPQQ